MDIETVCLLSGGGASPPPPPLPPPPPPSLPAAEVFSECWEGVACYRIPLVLAVPERGARGGVALLAIAEARRWTCNDYGPKWIAVARSVDLGQSWGRAQLLATATTAGANQAAPGLNLGSALHDPATNTTCAKSPPKMQRVA